MPQECDVLVIGAGPAGSVTALSLAKKGFNVTLIEKQDRIGAHTQNKIDITEDSGLSHIIKELDLPIKERTNKSCWFSPNYSLCLKSKIYDLYIKRGSSSDSFDVLVSNSAFNAGTNLLLETTPIKFDLKEGLINSVKTNKSTIKPRIVIGADGANSTVNKLLQIKEKRVATIMGYGIMGTDFDIHEKETHIFFDTKNAPGGYFFVGKTDTGEGVACVVVDKAMVARPLKRCYEDFVRDNVRLTNILKNASVENDFTGMSYAGFIKKRVKGNLVLVGDAARTLDPLFGYGVRNAIISGYTAAEVISNALESEDCSRLDNYNKKLNEKISNIKKNALMRKAFKGLHNDDFDHIVRMFRDLQKQGFNLDDLGNRPDVVFKILLKNIYPSLRLGFRCFSSLLS